MKFRPCMEKSSRPTFHLGLILEAMDVWGETGEDNINISNNNITDNSQ